MSEARGATGKKEVRILTDFILFFSIVVIFQVWSEEPGTAKAGLPKLETGQRNETQADRNVF